MNEDAVVRNKLRIIYERTAKVSTKVIANKKEQAEKFKDYFDWSETLNRSPSHRVLAMRRGENEGLLSMDISVDMEDCIAVVRRQFEVSKEGNRRQIDLASIDAYKRLIKPSLSSEFRVSSKLKADDDAIKVFAENLGGLLLASPLGQKRILALDPGFKTGCKRVVLGAQGEL